MKKLVVLIILLLVICAVSSAFAQEDLYVDEESRPTVRPFLYSSVLPKFLVIIISWFANSIIKLIVLIISYKLIKKLLKKTIQRYRAEADTGWLHINH